MIELYLKSDDINNRKRYQVCILYLGNQLIAIGYFYYHQLVVSGTSIEYAILNLKFIDKINFLLYSNRKSHF